MATGFGFPFHIDPAGRIVPDPDENADLHGKIVQVLFTMPGERVNLPEFGCGLMNLVFEPNNPVLHAAAEFSTSQALIRWLGDQIIIDSVDITSAEECVTVEVKYTRRADLAPQALRISFQ